MNINNGKAENPDAKLSFLERVAYGIGDYSGNLVYSSISAFLLVYYCLLYPSPSPRDAHAARRPSSA